MLRAWKTWARVESGLSPRTIEAYERELRRLGPGLPHLHTDDLRRVLHERAGSPSTVARRVAAFRSFYGFLIRTGKRTDDPTAGLDRPRVTRGLPRPVANHESRIASLGSPFAEIAVLLLETGLRISEACALEVPIPIPGQIRVRGKGGKDRVVPLSGQARRALAILGGRVEPSARTIQRHFAAAGFTPHRLRHTAATEWIASGADIGDVKELLGHASVATTQIYAAFGQARLREAVERRARRSRDVD